MVMLIKSLKKQIAHKTSLGVLFKDVSTMIEGASNAVKNLRLLGKKVYFVTNNSMATIEWHVERFREFQTNKNEFIRYV